MSPHLGSFAQKVLIATAIPVVVIALLFIFTQALAVLLLAFTAILLAVFLYEKAWRYTRLCRSAGRWCSWCRRCSPALSGTAELDRTPRRRSRLARGCPRG